MNNMQTKKIIGLMSGTSCDSVDAGFGKQWLENIRTELGGINHD